MLQKLKVYIPNIEKTHHPAHRNHPTCRGVAKIDRLPEEALMLQSSPAMIAIFSRLLGSNEIYNAFDVPQVVMPGENQSYKGLAVDGNRYVCVLTFTRQYVGENANQMTVPEGTLIIYDALRAPGVMPRNPANSPHIWYGMRITYWNQSLFDGDTRNAIYLTGAFGVYVATDTRRKIQRRREFLLNMCEDKDDDRRSETVRKTCISWNKEKDMDINEMKKETEQLIAKGEPFPQQFVVDGNKVSGGCRQRRRCHHTDCRNNNQEYANINQHVRLMHIDEKRQTPKSCPHPDCQNKQKQYVNVKLHMTMKHMPQNETCTRMKTHDDLPAFKEEDDFRNEEKAVKNVSTKRNMDEREDEVEKKEYDYNKKFKSKKNVTFASPLIIGRRNRLSLGKKYKVTSQIIPATQGEDIAELEEALEEMSSIDSHISCLHTSSLPPTYEGELGEAPSEMNSVGSPISPLDTSSPPHTYEGELGEVMGEINSFESLHSPIHPSPPRYKERADEDVMDIGEAFTEMKNNSIQFSPQQSLGEEDECEVKKFTQMKTKLPSTMSEVHNKKVNKLRLRHDYQADKLNINLVNLPPHPPRQRMKQTSENEKWPKLVAVSVTPCRYGKPLPFSQFPVTIPLSPLMPPSAEYDEWFEEEKKRRDEEEKQEKNRDKNQIISLNLDKLEEVLKSTMECENIDVEEDYEDPEERKRKRKPTKAEDDQVYPLTSTLMDHPSYDERDAYNYDDDDENRGNARTPVHVLEEIPKHLDLLYDICLDQTSVKKAQGTDVWIYTRTWMFKKEGTRENYLSNLVFCDTHYLQGRFPTPTLMITDEEYRLRRCYIRTKSENKVYEIRGANTVMDVVRIFYQGIRKVNERGRKRREQPYCFFLCDTDLGLLNATENEVYCVKRVPQFLAQTYPRNEQYFFYPRPNNDIDVKLDYVPNISAMEEALPCGLSSVMKIPKEKKERVCLLGNFLEDNFKLRYPGINVSSKTCKELAKELLELCNNIDPTTAEVHLPCDLDGIIKKHREGRAQIIRYAMDALIDNKMKDNSMRRIKAEAMEQFPLMRHMASTETVIGRLYRETDYIGEGDILLLGIVVYEETFSEALREFDRKGDEMCRVQKRK